MPVLKLRSITCKEQQEWGQDELYVTFNGTKRSLPGMKIGQTKSLGQEFVFTGTPKLRLYENDGNHWYDRDDFIASHSIGDTLGDFALRFKGDGADYSISMTVFDETNPPVSALLRLNFITCIEQAETFTDELYVTFNGTKRSLPNMEQGQTKMLGDEFLFAGNTLLTLFENDGDHWYDRDDFIAAHVITPTPVTKTLRFDALPLDGSGNPFGGGYPAKYEIDVTISAVGGIL